MRIGRVIRIAVVTVVAAGACLFAVAVAGPRTVRARLWRAVLTRPVEPAQARMHLAWLLGGEDRLPASLEVLESDVRAGRDSTYFFKVRVDPNEVPAFRDGVRGALRRRDAAGFSDADDPARLPLAYNAPPWWRPEELAGADIVTTPEWRFVFSRATGVVYVAEVGF